MFEWTTEPAIDLESLTPGQRDDLATCWVATENNATPGMSFWQRCREAAADQLGVGLCGRHLAELRGCDTLEGRP